MAIRPRWTTLNLAALSAATAAARIPRTADLVSRAASRDGLLEELVRRFPLHGPAERRLLDRAVVLERVGGATWTEIAATLRTGARAAELRFGRAERTFLFEDAFPVRRTVGGRLRRPEFEVLDGPDAHLRTLEGLSPAWAPSPTALLEIDDATWIAGEQRVLARMRREIDARDLPADADRVEARLAYEGRRLACLSCELRLDQAGTPDPALVDEIAEATAECVTLVAVLAGARAVDAPGRPVASRGRSVDLADRPVAPRGRSIEFDGGPVTSSIATGGQLAALAERAVRALEIVDGEQQVAGG